MPVVNPYLNFRNNCEEAFDFYRSVFGGEFVTKMRFTDMDCGMPIPENESQKIMHVALPIGGGTVLMGSDVPESMGTVVTGSNFSIAIGADSEEEADRLFDGLSAGGKVMMPMDKAFWGAYFGMFTDKFGIGWMVSYDQDRQK